MGSQHGRGVTQGAAHYNSGPNAALIAEVSDVTPGRAIDLGCGTGANAIWLASHGWIVTAVDRSEAAIDKARVAAREPGVTVNWICGDFVEQPPPERSFDLVTAFYPALLKSAGDDAVESLVGGVAEGGTLLVVGHSPESRVATRSQAFDPNRYMEPSDILARLDPTEWDTEMFTLEEPSNDLSKSSPSDRDVILKAKRRHNQG